MTASALKSPKTEGLSPLDRDRAASLADEGGTSAAAVETQEAKPARKSDDIDLDDTLPIKRPRGLR
jgi:hypothetical protein